VREQRKQQDSPEGHIEGRCWHADRESAFDAKIVPIAQGQERYEWVSVAVGLPNIFQLL